MRPGRLMGWSVQEDEVGSENTLVDELGKEYEWEDVRYRPRVNT